MANYLKSDHINAMETDGVMLSPEQRGAILAD